MVLAVWLYLWLGLAAIAAAVVNSVAGGGTLLTFPALMAAMPAGMINAAVVANGTSTVALVPASLAGAWGYRRELNSSTRLLLLLSIPSFVGGLTGSLLVTELDPRYFHNLVPWLILTATLLFLLQPLVTRHVKVENSTPAGPKKTAGVIAFQFLVAVYGGYFGGGIGILMLSSLGLMGIGNIHTMNGIKNFLAACINGISVVVFAMQGVVDWRYAAFMAPIAAVGAYAGSRLTQKLDRRIVRWIVIVIGFGLATLFFYERWSRVL